MRDHGRRAFLRTVGGTIAAAAMRAQNSRTPNVIVILADDLGYGDLGCFGSRIPTPNLDAMAADGIRLTRFYSASPVCSPSRVALLTGRYPVRAGVVNVLLPNADDGLHDSERTLPKILRQRGYRTACIGKWHLGTRYDCTALRNGFDEFYGVPYSNDMYPLPMLRNNDIADNAPKQTELTEHFTGRAVDFIGRNKDNPFFLYLSHTAPHIPLAPSARFKGKSGQGAYGDVVMELDWSVGEVLNALKANGIDDNTLVVFTSDNGPWYQGSVGSLQGRKGSTYEGGVREPCIIRFPGRITPGSESIALSSTMDLLPTIAGLCGASVPASSVDGVDLWPAITGEKPYIDREALLFFDTWQIQCVRWGPWKLHVARYNSYAWTQDPPGGRWNLPLPSPELYNIEDDPSESYDRSQERPDLVKDLLARVETLLLGMPEMVRSCWADTVKQRVQATPVGALPRKEP